MKEKPIKVKGFSRFLLQNAKTGRIEKYAEVENQITNIGYNMMTNAIHAAMSTNATSNIIRYGAIGSSQGAPASNADSLGGEWTVARVTCAGANLSSKTCQSSWSYATDAGNSAIGCIGLYGTATGSNLIAGATVTPMTKTTSQTLSITYQLRFT